MDDVRITVERDGDRVRVGSGSRFEPVMGFARAVRRGHTVAVSGTLGIEPDGSLAPDVAAQTRRALVIIRAALESLGARVDDVVRTRIFVRDARHFEQVAVEHGRLFATVRPACTFVEVSRFVVDEALVEIEADAVVA
jgi:enamine deaminase RidA (YjgF/YER057c/UK114 family)